MRISVEVMPRSGIPGLWRGITAYAVMGTFLAFQFTLQGITSLMVPELKADLDLSEAGIGMLSSMFFYPYVLLQVPAGRLLNSLGVRRLMMAAILIMATGCWLQSMGENFLTAASGRFLMGLGAAPGIVCFFATVEHCFPGRLFGVLVSGAELFGMLGAGFSDFFVPAGIKDLGWRVTLQIFPLLLLLLMMVGRFVLPSRARHSRVKSSPSSEENWRAVLTDSRIWLVAVFSGLMFAVVNAFAALWAVPFLTRITGLAGHAEMLSGMIFIGAAMGAPCMGWCFDHHFNVRRLMFIFSLAAAALSLLVILVEMPLVLSYLVLLLMGFFSAIYLMPFMIAKKILNKGQLFPGLALVNTLSVMIGALLYQPIIGGLLSMYSAVTLDSYRHVLLIIPLGMLLSSALMIYFHEESSEASVAAQS